MLEVRNVSKAYQGPQGRVQVLDGVDLDLGEGESLALMGESGSGKSTLLHLIAGLDQVDDGSIRLGTVHLSNLGEAGRARYRREDVAVVFQQFNLVPSLTVAENLALQARLAGRLDTRWQAHLISALGLDGLLDRLPEQLSGGQQQRVAVGRALALRPRLILADEPTGNLDEQTAEQVLDLLLERVAESGSALLMVTHSTTLADRLQRQLKLSRGRVVES
ncbi:putative ABC transport system ATP-binding protein [Halopseudomonas xinjiangensis]|uniref:Putative ABC transport system ATP-binding protein n=1 Tax=Halopseudomonas xinjiangensis TaxID=487184 RepID=A0A1H1YZR6_9GAMM|nr:ABC transporter ATP-binding protein [Halopseudomonas xinjiangensis]SDT26903.1 putative ABC transport system ATP-binding protein [Halopseudomonas xinjiangensis]